MREKYKNTGHRVWTHFVYLRGPCSSTLSVSRAEQVTSLSRIRIVVSLTTLGHSMD